MPVFGARVDATTASAPRRTLAAASAVALTLGLVAAVTTAATADAAPIASRDATSDVTADALPTAQIDGVVRDQEVVGDTVFVGGKFANARPAGSAAGTNLAPRSNLMAYSLSTGVMTSWAPSANGQVLTTALSPDKKRLYVAGEFTAINGVNRQRVAAFDTATGALITSFAPRADTVVKAIVATATTVYIGGSFSAANAIPRSRLAAFSAADGSLLPWNPGANVTVWSMTTSPDESRIIVGGGFDQIASHAATGLAALDPVTGAWVDWAATNTVSAWGQGNNGPGTGAAIYALSHDDTNVYGTGYNYYGNGNLEGAFSAQGNSGAVNWVEDCHGDTYGVWASSSAVYTVGHAHYCGNIGGFPQTSPTWTFHHSLAFSKQATGTATHDPLGYADWFGTATPSLKNWFPDFTPGKYTGLNQAGYTVTGNDNYVVIGGEYTAVNGTAQQGLVRFGTPSVAPKKQGPRAGSVASSPSLRPLSNSSVRVAWPSNFDRDDQTLTYAVGRVGKGIVYQTTADSQFWNRPTLAYLDTGLTPGTTYQYYIRATDGDGNAQFSPNISVTTPTNLQLSKYASDVFADGAANYWRLDEASGTAVTDWAGTDDLTLNGGYTQGASGAIVGDADTATTFNGSDGFGATQTMRQGPNTFGQELWFKTTSRNGGKILGFGDRTTGTSSNYDRHVYMNPDGTVTFGVYNNASYTVTTPNALNDGQWHQVATGLSATGLVLYVDGKRIGTNAGTTTGQAYAGYWRVGGDSPWSGNAYFDGTIDDVAIYPKPLTLAQVRTHYVDSGRPLGSVPAPTDAYGKAVTADEPDFYYRLDESDNTARDASGNGNDGRYSGNSTRQTASPVTGSGGTGVTFDGNSGTVGSSGPVSNPKTYSEELWFNTTTNGGGKLIGFGNRQDGNSGSYDRHVYMLNSGQLVFGTYTGVMNTATSPSSYNDGKWHHLVATQSDDGMKLYVDNTVVATNGQTGQEGYNGYWRIGGDTSWAANNYFAGKIDEAAIYSVALTPAQIASHYNASSVANKPPTAAFDATTTFLRADVDASASTDSDGAIASYAWNFGDSTIATGKTATHDYTAPGTYTITLTVTDDGGATAVTTRDVTVAAKSPNQAPAAAFSADVNRLAVSFDAGASTDADGTVDSYAWDFGDGTTGTGRTAGRTYATAGNYQVTLTVTDNEGKSASTVKTVTAVAPNKAPTAGFSASVNRLAASFDAGASTDSDGTVSSYAWDFGDSTSGTGATPNHTYVAAGTYLVSLTVTDNDGATNTVTKSVTPVAPNKAPTAAFTSTVNGLVATFDSSTTNDTDGTVASYAWTFGDGATSSSQNPSRTYATGGTYQVTLTVTDNDGATNSVTKTVTAVSPPSATVVADDFERSVTNAWGNAVTGGPWTRSGGAASDESVNGRRGTMTMTAPGRTTAMYLNGVSQRDVSGSVDIGLTTAPTGGGAYATTVVRRTSSGEYRARLRLQPGVTTLFVTKVVGTTETTLASKVISGLSYTVGDTLRIAFSVTGNGTTAVAAKVWNVTQAQPSAWQVTANDTTASLQAAGSVGFVAYLSGVAGTTGPLTMLVDNLIVRAE